MTASRAALLAAALLALDVVTKVWAHGLDAPGDEPVAIVLAWVPYARWSKCVGLVAFAVFAALLPVWRQQDPRFTTVLALASAGGVSNAVEALATAHVTDWIMVQLLGLRVIGNLADVWLTAGMVLLALAFIRPKGEP